MAKINVEEPLRQFLLITHTVRIHLYYVKYYMYIYAAADTHTFALVCRTKGDMVCAEDECGVCKKFSYII